MFYKSILIMAGLLVIRLAGATSIGAIRSTRATVQPGTYTVEAIVTGVYADLKPAGFYVQDDPATADGNPTTSDALFVVQPDPTVAVGDRVARHERGARGGRRPLVHANGTHRTGHHDGIGGQRAAPRLPRSSTAHFRSLRPSATRECGCSSPPPSP